ncbi:MAG: hypothetical protein ACLFRY_16140 [Spirochaetia bacterium]
MTIRRLFITRPAAAASVLFTIALLTFFPAPAGAQEIVEKIPQRVYFSMTGEIPPIEERGTIASLPEIYYTTVSDRQPIVRVEEPDNAHSLVEIEAEEIPGGVAVRVRLIRQGEEVYFDDFPYTGDIDVLLAFVDRSSKGMSGYLGLVEPKVIVAEEVQDAELRQMVQKIDFADKTAESIELTVWLNGLSRNFTYDMQPIDRFSIFPINLEAAWFPSRNIGIKAALLFDYFDISGDADFVPNLFIFPGIGFQYRTLGRIIAGFGITQYFGGVIANGGFSFIPLTTFEPSLGVNITPWLGVKVRFGFGLNTGFFFGAGEPDTSTDYNMLFSIGALGLTVRF